MVCFEVVMVQAFVTVLARGLSLMTFRNITSRSGVLRTPRELKYKSAKYLRSRFYYVNYVIGQCPFESRNISSYTQ